MTYTQKLRKYQNHYKGVFKAILASVEPEPRVFYACKACASSGELHAHTLPTCPICGSRYVNLAQSEYKLNV